MKARYSSIFFLCSFFAFLYVPYVFLFSHFSWENIEHSVLIKIFMMSTTQAGLSALGTLILSVFGSSGLFWLEQYLSQKKYTLVEFFILLPALLPSIFIIVSVLNIIPHFPFGLPGVVFLHVLSEVGMVSLILKRIFAHKFFEISEWALTSGSSSFFFLRRAFPMIKTDLLYIFLVLLFYFLTSFSIPLILGTHSFVGVEVVIFEKIILAHQWNSALTLFLYQSVLLMLLLVGMSFVKNINNDVNQTGRLRLLENSFGTIPLFIPPLILVISAFWSSARGFVQLQKQTDILLHWPMYISGSLLVGFLSGGFVFVLLSICTYFLQFNKTKYFFASLVTPSFVILAFAFRPQSLVAEVLAPAYLAWALCIAFLPAVLRLGVLQTVDQLNHQIEMAHFLGAHPWHIFTRVTWPQTLPQICWMSGLTSVWAIGDFSLSRVILGSDQTLAMWVHSLVEHYRWDSAQLLSGLILICGAVVFSFFAGVAYVCRQKLI